VTAGGPGTELPSAPTSGSRTIWLHLAAALELGDDLDGLVTYDDRLGGAAQLHGISVITPGSWPEPGRP
jgi:hypothetical protein